jgi:hypothetical protein
MLNTTPTKSAANQHQVEGSQLRPAPEERNQMLVPARPQRWQQIRSAYRETLPPLLHQPAAWVLAALCLVGCLTLILSGYSGDVLSSSAPQVGQRPHIRVSKSRSMLGR